MNPNQPENIPEQKKEQQQQTVTHQAIDKKEEAPVIKSEENKENWKRFREQRDLERKQKEEADKRAAEKAAEAEALKAALEALTNKPSRKSNIEYEDSDEEETEEQRIDKRVRAIIEEKEKQYEKEYQQREIQEYPKRLIQLYPDYNNVVSKENLDYIDFHYPELGAPFKYMPDGFDKAAALYNLVKKFVPNIDIKKDQAKVEKNLQKPGSVSNAGPSHGGNSTPAYKLTEERKMANYERMMRTMKGLS
jgi:phage-related minor tail protein